MLATLYIFSTHDCPWCYVRFLKMLKDMNMQRVLLVPNRRGLRRQKIDQPRPYKSIEIDPHSPHFDGGGPSGPKFHCTARDPPMPKMHYLPHNSNIS